MGRMLMIMPLMMMVSKVDMKDENTLLMARAAWLAVIGLQHMVFSIIVSGKIRSANDQTVIYAPPPPPQRGEMTKTTYCEHEQQQVKVFKSQLFMNTLVMFGIHWYFGVAVLPLMQTLLGPLNMMDNVLFKKHVLGQTVEKAWGELTEAEYKAKQQGGSVAASDGKPKSKSNVKAKAQRVMQKDDKLEDAILSAWDGKRKADLKKLCAAVADSPDYQTFDEDVQGWSALMVAAGAPVDTKQQLEAGKALLAAGADTQLADAEGWTAFHWACFHGQPAMVRWLLEQDAELFEVEDKKGKTGIALAKEEGNKDVVRACEEWHAAHASQSGEADAKHSATDTGARQRRGPKGGEDKVVADDDDIHDVD